MSGSSPPPWVEEWCSRPLDLPAPTIAQIRALAQRSDADRAFLIRFPPGAVVRYLDAGGGDRFGIVVDVQTQPCHVLALASSPHRDGRRSTHAPDGMEPIGYAGAWTPSTVALLLDGADAGG